MTANPTLILEGLHVRNTRRADAQVIVDLINAAHMADSGTPTITLDELLTEWQDAIFDPETSSWVVLDGEQIVGFQEVWDARPPFVSIGVFGRVHPDYRNRGVGTHMLRLAEAESRQRMHKAPPEARVVIGTGCDSRNRDAKALLEAEGFSHIRSFWRMRIDLDAPPAAPVLPSNIVIRTQADGIDPRVVHEALNDGFQDHWGFNPMPWEMFEQFMIKNPKYDPSLWFLAMDGDQIAGISLCINGIAEDPEMGWVEDLAVRRQYRKQGLGLALLHHTFGEFWRRGVQKVGLGVDASSLTGATRLYERAGMHQDEQWDRYEKELRPGVELRTVSLEG